MPGKRVPKNIIQLVYFNSRTTRLKRIYRQAEKGDAASWNKTVYNGLHFSTRGLALQVEIDLGLRISHETIRNILEKHKYSSGVKCRPL